MMINQSIIKYISISFFSLIAFLYFFLFTESSLRFNWYILSHFLPANITIHNLRGNLFKGISWEKMTYKDNHVFIIIYNSNIQWEFRKFFSNLSLLISITIESAKIHIIKCKNNKSFTIPSYYILKYFNIVKAYVSNIEVNTVNTHYYIKWIKITTSDGRHYITLNSPQGQLWAEYIMDFKPVFLLNLSLFGSLKQTFIHLKGIIGNQCDVKWDISVAKINEFNPYFMGSAKMSGQLFGNPLLPKINSQILFKNLCFQSPHNNKHIGSIHFNSKINTKLNKEISIKFFQCENYKIPLIQIKSHSFINRDNLTIHSDIRFDQNNSASVNLLIPSFHSIANIFPNVSIEIFPQFNNLMLFNSVLSNISDLRSVHGRIHGKAVITGIPVKPRFRGEFFLSNAGFYFSASRISISELLLHAYMPSLYSLTFSGSFSSGNGKGNINGYSNWGSSSPFLILNLTGNNLLVYNTNEYKVRISPAIKVVYQNKFFNVSGNLLVTEANISPQDFSMILELPSDVIVIDQFEAPHPRSLDNLALSLHLQFKDHIYIHFKNLQAKLNGKLFLLQQPGSHFNAIGELFITKGLYSVFGKKLSITKGRLIYVGNRLMNPGLDIMASTKMSHPSYAGQSFTAVNNTEWDSASIPIRRIGVRVQGTLQNPLLSLFSSPPGLSQTDIMSYFLFGKPQSELSYTNALSLLNMVGNLSNGINPLDITNYAKVNFGLDEFGLSSAEYYNPTENTMKNTSVFAISKHLAPHLSLHYSVSIFDNISILSLRYSINKYLFLQTEKSRLENSGDFFFQLESNN